MSSAELALSARVDGLTQAEVQDALWKKRELVKTWTIRGTLHLHSADDLPLWAAATRAVAEPDDADVVDAIADALDGRCLLREELADEVATRVGEWAREKIGSGWAYLFGTAARLGKLCHGPPRGKNVTFVRTDQWVDWREVDPGEALVEAYRRFAATYGPAGPRQFAQWFGIKPAGLPPMPDVAVEPEAAAGPLRLLPEYDCYVMGFRERDQLMPESVRERIKSHPKGRYESVAGVPTVLVDGVVAGIWRRAKSGKKVEIAVDLARRPTKQERGELEEEAERIARFLGVEPVLTVS
jgi:winged helix DNA-binding protein